MFGIYRKKKDGGGGGKRRWKEPRLIQYHTTATKKEVKGNEKNVYPTEGKSANLFYAQQINP